MSDIDKRRAGAAVALGTWLIAVAVLFPNVVSTGAAFAYGNYLLVGLGIVGLSAYSWWAAGNDLPGKALAAFGLIPLGLWLIALPFYTTATDAGWLPWQDLAFGFVITWIGWRNAFEALDADLNVLPSPREDAG